MVRRIVLCALLLGGCGGDDDDDDDDVICFCDAGWRGIDSGLVPCNPISQTGCDLGQRCAFVLRSPGTGAGDVQCVPDGARAIGESCTEPTLAGEFDDCQRGGTCRAGSCHEICTTVNDQCLDGLCVTYLDGTGNPLPIEICEPNCDALVQDCPPGEGCYPLAEFACIEAGSLGAGEGCTALNACAPGLVCIGAGPDFVCRGLCGPWMECYGDDGSPLACGCGATLSCAVDEVCFPIGDGLGGAVDEIAGVCIGDTEADCDCGGDPICPGSGMSAAEW